MISVIMALALLLTLTLYSVYWLRSARTGEIDSHRREADKLERPKTEEAAHLHDVVYFVAKERQEDLPMVTMRLKRRTALKHDVSLMEALDWGADKNKHQQSPGRFVLSHTAEGKASGRSQSTAVAETYHSPPSRLKATKENDERARYH